ncbi:TraU family protein [Neiella sp. HB171785]|uniref:TraU family protein n=1 Tax=Neiella litorisoli TaxID=2771431 RepID=A0A8J6UEA1_9GAMM|nr:TraU family protein [Neiella litorisoli]MBD1389384.1 TraU family protein [Neiella litorisoli]
MKPVVTLALLCLLMASPAAKADMCPDADLWSGIIDKICWTRIFPISLMGLGDKPDGSAPPTSVCACTDPLGVPEVGWQLGIWLPARIAEVVRVPWCSPSLNTRLQSSFGNMGVAGGQDGHGNNDMAMLHYHYFSFPLATMLEMFVIPDCMQDGMVDFDLMYMSEVDPTWNDDVLALALNPEAVAFSTPPAKLWCMADCVATTAGVVQEEFFGSAGCDASCIYPFTGHINAASDPVRNSSLITQRLLASLHRKGLALKTMGLDAMCDREFAPMLPRSMYQLQMFYPVAEASSTTVTIPKTDTDGYVIRDASGNPETINSPQNCAHPLGESIHKWSTPVGGRHRPGMEDFVYVIWRYTDCCVRELPGI